jgi:hypothetical protein
MKAAVLALALTGCANLPSDPFLVPPTSQRVMLNVEWSTPEEIAKRCGPNALACATHGGANIPASTIWMQKPRGWADPLVCTAGHELMHALGARHPRDAIYPNLAALRGKCD